MPSIRWFAFISAIAGAIAAALTGCASLAPRYKAPPLPVAATYPRDSDPPVAGAGVTPTWRDYFTDPRLQDLIARALRSNRDLRTAVSRIQETRAQYGIQRADLFPTLSAQGFALRSQTIGSNGEGQSWDFSLTQIGLNLSGWELDFWGRVRSLKQEALQNYLASEESRRAVTVSLIAQVAATYYTIRALDERIMLARETIVTRQESFSDLHTPVRRRLHIAAGSDSS